MNSFLVYISLIFFPGIIATIICDKITDHTEKWGYFKYTLYSFIFGITSYILAQILFLLLYRFTLVGEIRTALDSFFSSPMIISVFSAAILTQHQVSSVNIITDVLFSTILSPFVAALAAVIINYKLLMKLSNKFKISNKYGDESLYYYFLNSKQTKFVTVRDNEKGLTYQGNVSSFSLTESIQELLLSEVIVYDYESSQKLYFSPFIYISKPPGGFAIEFPEEKNEESS